MSITFKKYEPRPEIELKKDVCECGHDNLSHHNLLEIFLMDIKNDSCEKCMCPKFNKITSMSRVAKTGLTSFL